jgi:hypothetical protein
MRLSKIGGCVGSQVIDEISRISGKYLPICEKIFFFFASFKLFPSFPNLFQPFLPFFSFLRCWGTLNNKKLDS